MPGAPRPPSRIQALAEAGREWIAALLHPGAQSKVALRAMGRALAEFYRDDGVMLAGALSYFLIMALVPLSLLVVTLFGYLLGEDKALFGYLSGRLASIFPESAAGASREMIKLVRYRGLAPASLALYAFLAYQYYDALQSAMARAFKTGRRRGVLGRVIFPLVMVSGLMALLFASFAASVSALPLLKALEPQAPALVAPLLATASSFLVRYVLPLLVAVLGVSMLYLVVPKRRVAVRHALAGGLFTALMIEAAKHIFAWYMANLSSLGTVYGSLTAFVTVLLWVYYSSAILLLGAEFVHELGRGRKTRREMQAEMRMQTD